MKRERKRGDIRCTLHVIEIWRRNGWVTVIIIRPTSTITCYSTKHTHYTSTHKISSKTNPSKGERKEKKRKRKEKEKEKKIPISLSHLCGSYESESNSFQNKPAQNQEGDALLHTGNMGLLPSFCWFFRIFFFTQYSLSIHHSIPSMSKMKIHKRKKKKKRKNNTKNLIIWIHIFHIKNPQQPEQSVSMKV